MFCVSLPDVRSLSCWSHVISFNFLSFIKKIIFNLFFFFIYTQLHCLNKIFYCNTDKHQLFSQLQTTKKNPYKMFPVDGEWFSGGGQGVGGRGGHLHSLVFDCPLSSEYNYGDHATPHGRQLQHAFSGFLQHLTFSFIVMKFENQNKQKRKENDTTRHDGSEQLRFPGWGRGAFSAFASILLPCSSRE